MRRIARWLLMALAALSLLLCLATTAMWILSRNKAPTKDVRLRGVTYHVALRSGALSIDNAPQIAASRAALLPWANLKAQAEILEVEAQTVASRPDKDRELYLKPLMARLSVVKHQLLALPRPVPPPKPWAARARLPIASALAGLSTILSLTLRSLVRPQPPGGLRCSRCRYDLTGNVTGICPECGTKIAQVSRD